MIICLKVKTLDSQTYDFTVDNEISVRQFKETIAEKTNISADLQRIIYCGRVLADEKQLKEYDVNGKVVHVVERPPPSSRITTNIIDTNNRRQRDELDATIRGNPIFRALDGMVVGALTIPVTTAGGQPAQASIPPLNPSSSFCMNRITVARHMLECANNIALYLENPERGLNNASLDILTQGRWTMESTVFEVGISAAVEIPQNQTQNLVGALRGAVSAALQNGHPNVTVVQLPNVFGSNGTATVVPPPSQGAGGNQSSTTDAPSENQETLGSQRNQERGIEVNIDAVPTSTAPPESQNREAATENNTNPSNSSWQRTSTRTLGEVVQQMRTVQTRLEPFIQQYYDILMQDPTFEENNTAARENSQRIFDRVSEALHYMAHAQHAISDLMLDLSQPAPRYLCCRPILVEQGVRSNNYLASFLQSTNNNEPAAATNTAGNQASNTRPSAPSMPSAGTGETPNSGSRTASAAQPQQTTGASNLGQAAAGANTSSETSHSMTPPLIMPTRIRSASTNSANANPDSANQANPQLQVARLIQAVVNSAPLDADLHVQINAPNFLGFGMPMNASGQTQPQQQQNQQQPQQQNSQSQTQSNTSNHNNSNDSNIETGQARVTTATHPTTSTQTRSTARPQVHIANLPSSWNARVIPANMLSSFDRFLPCSSHHIRENETNEGNQNNIPNGASRTRVQTRQRRQQPQEATAATFAPMGHSTPTANSPPVTETPASNLLHFEEFNIPLNWFGSNLTLRDLINISPSSNTLNRIRNELHEFIVNTLFAGAPITEENMNNAINQVIQLLSDSLIFLQQYDLPDYDARASVENFIRNSLPFIINLIREDNSTEFGTRLLREMITFVRRLFVILVTCVGRSNAELYLTQISQMATTANNTLEQEAIRALQRHLMAAVIRELDVQDVQEFLVIRRPSTETQSGSVSPMDTDDAPQQADSKSEVRTESQSSTSKASAEFTSTSIGDQTIPPPRPVKSDEPLPSVVPGSEPWHNNFPTNWLPIITRDIEKQRRQSPQGSFSDAYISGMAAKRRKLVTSSKPPTDIPSLVSEGVRRAIQITGISPNESSAEEISTTIAADPSAQLSYREALRSRIRDRLRMDPDFTPDKFPDSSNCFNK